MTTDTTTTAPATVDEIATMTPEGYEAVRDQLHREGLWDITWSHEDEARSAMRAEEILRMLRIGRLS
jgi:hypothetical protein